MPAWRSVLMHMLVERCFKTNGIVEDCEIVKAKSDEYRVSQDYIAQFINEKITRGRELVKFRRKNYQKHSQCGFRIHIIKPRHLLKSCCKV